MKNARGIEMIKKFLAVFALTSLALSASANAASVTLTTTDDGDVTNLGVGITTNTTDPTILLGRSGPNNVSNAILGFDLSGIADGSTINSAILEFTLTRFTVGGNLAVDIFANAGDGVIDNNDFLRGGAAEQVGSDLSIAPAAGVGIAETRSLTLTNLAILEGLLAGDSLELRLAMDPALSNFTQVIFASLENSTVSAAQLTVDFTTGVSTIPLPGGLLLLLGGLSIFGIAGIRRRTAAT